MNVAIEAQDLTKNFSGLLAVSRLDLQVPAGSVLGLIGRNGAGKTTLIRLLMGLLRADGGIARILGEDLWRADFRARSRVAYVPQAQQLHAWMTLEELCHYAGLLYARWDAPYARRLAGRFGLAWGQQIGLMSGGLQRKAAVVLAFAARPEALLLDEPAAGLDPIARRELISEIVDTVADGAGTTILLSTHIISDLERIADTVAFMDRGRIVRQGSLEQLQGRLRRVQVIFAGPMPEGFVVPGAAGARVEGAVVTAIVDVASDTQLDAVRRMPGVRVTEFPLGLEDIFIELMGPQTPEEVPQ